MIITQLIFLLFIIFFIRYKKKAVLYIIPLSLFFTMLPVVRIGGTYIGLCDAINFVIYGYILGRKDARKAIFCNPLFLPLFGNFILLLLIALYGTERTSLYVLWKTISNEILLPLAFIYFLRTKNDIKLIVNLYLKVFWVLCIYGIIEFLLNYNIILYWLQSQTDLSFWVDHTNDIRYGYGRYNSTLSKILCKWKQDSAVSLFLYLDSVFKNKHKLIHNQAPVMNRLCPFLLNLHK
jgi:hypothetical protein